MKMRSRVFCRKCIAYESRLHRIKRCVELRHWLINHKWIVYESPGGNLYHDGPQDGSTVSATPA